MFIKNITAFIWAGCICRLHVFFILLSIAVSCRQTSNNAAEAYFDSVLQKIDSSLNNEPFKYTITDMALLDSAFSSLHKASIDNIANRNLRKVFYYADTKSNFGKAVLYADSNINLLEEHTSNEKFAGLFVKTLFAKAHIYRMVKKYDDAIYNYTKGKTFFIPGKPDSAALYEYYQGMAEILFAQQKYLEVTGLYHILSVIDSCASKNQYFAFMNAAGDMHDEAYSFAKAGMPDSAFFYYNAALDYINRNEKRFYAVDPDIFDFHRCKLYYNYGVLLYINNDLAGAKKFFLKSMAGASLEKRLLARAETPIAQNDLPFTKHLQRSLASLYLKTSEIQKVKELLFDSVYASTAKEMNKDAADYYKLLSEYLLRTNQPVAAYNALLQNLAIKDSIEKKDDLLNVIDSGRDFEKQEQKQINETLQKDNAIKNGYLLIAVTSASLGVIVILLIWYNLNRKSRYVKKLTLLNTDINQKNDDLQKAFTSLEQSHYENNHIMRVVAHDLKNPISAIRLLVYSLLKTEPAGESREALLLVQSTCTDSIALIKDLLNNKRSLKDISKELVDMGRLIEQCAELLQVKAEEKNQHLKLQLDHPLIMLNRQKIWRVISNIVNNAIKFSPANAEITIRLETKDGSVLLSVHDNGIGIPVGLKEKIFTIDSNVCRAGTAGEKSYGLGLSISRKIIEEHAGQLWFESEAGKGSVFYVQLPYSEN